MSSRAPHQDGDETRSASVGLRIKPSLKSALEVLARGEARTLNSYIERALEHHVDNAKTFRGRKSAERKGASQS
jgi:predicted HicB family RNase H-like nuclease